MTTENNLILNGNFKDGSLSPWTLAYGDEAKLVFRDYTAEKKVLLLEPAEVLEQRLDVSKIGSSRRFKIKVTARANPNMDIVFVGEPELPAITMQEGDPDSAPEASHSMSFVTLTFSLAHMGGETGKIMVAEVSNGMQLFEAEAFFENFPDTIVGAGVSCRTPMYPFPEYDRRHIWVTGFEIIPLD